MAGATAYDCLQEAPWLPFGLELAGPSVSTSAVRPRSINPFLSSFLQFQISGADSEFGMFVLSLVHTRLRMPEKG